MGCSDQVGTFSLSAEVATTSPQFVAAGDWIPAVGLSAVDFALTIETITGNAELVPGYQLAAVRPRSPNAPVTASTSWTTAPVSQVRVGIVDTGVFWFRPGVFARIAPGGPQAPGYFQAGLTVSKVQCGGVVGQREIEALPPADVATPETHILTPWVPAVGVDRFRGIVVSTDTADLEAQFRCRTAIDPDLPGSWFGLGSWQLLATGNGSWNTGSGGTDLSIPAGANLGSSSRIQLALGTRMRSGGSHPHGMLRVMAALTYT